MNTLLKKVNTLLFLIFCLVTENYAQIQDNQTKDSLYIFEVEDKLTPDKVLHAEPLYIDLIRDLGARKGENEWNIGLGLTDNTKFDSYEALIEYEFAPINRLGLEVELPFTFYAPQNGNLKDSIPSDRLESLKLATQWSFFVNEKVATSMAVGYIHEFEISDFRNFANPLFNGNIFNPFLIIAKRWGNNFHTLVYTGPRVERSFSSDKTHTIYEIHSNVHYMIPGTRNFIGVEVNKEIDNSQLGIVFRPQMRVGIADNLMVGIVAGVPVDKGNERLSTFIRLIWEPKHKIH